MAAAEADVVQAAVVAQGDDAAGVDAVVADAVVAVRRAGCRWGRLSVGRRRPGWGAAAEGAVGADGVVVAAEGVELGLQLAQGGGRGGWLGEPLLEGLVEPFDLAAGLRVVGPGVAEEDAAGVQGDLEGDPRRGRGIGR